ncbi:MAG: hypothetical protein NVSMB32_11780 [Actinomycetota bacterium]
MRIKRLAVAGVLMVGMSVPVVASIASAGPSAGPTPFKLDVTAGQSGVTATVNDSDKAAEFNVDDGQVEEVGEHGEANESGTVENGAVSNDQSTAGTDGQQTGEHTDAGDHGVTGTVAPSAHDGGSQDQGQANN